MKVKIDNQLKHIFPEPEDIWDWRLHRCSGKEEPEPNWRAATSEIIRNMCKEAQYLMLQKRFAQWNKEYFGKLIESEDYKNNIEGYSYICLYNQAKQEEAYIDRNLQKVADVIQDNIMMEYPDAMIPETDRDGNLYFHYRYYDDKQEEK